MGEVCIHHNVKLLTYGTLVRKILPSIPDIPKSPHPDINQCGGFLAEKWLQKPEPDLYGTEITPSQRKVNLFLTSHNTI